MDRRGISNLLVKPKRRTSLLFRAFSSTKVQPLLRAYKAYVRPILEYASPVWNPYLKTDIMSPERVQRFFTRKIFIRLQQIPPDYQERLCVLELETLQSIRLKTDLTHYYQILMGLIAGSNLSSKNR